MIINNNSLHPYIRDSYSLKGISEIEDLLQLCGTLHFPRLENGLFPAANLSERGRYTGYHNVWVRDNVHIAHAHYTSGQVDVAVKNTEALMLYFEKQRHRWEHIIQGNADPSSAMNRPHIRFNGKTLEDTRERWSHAQNDALGYFLWFYCKLACAGHLIIRPDEWEALGWFPLFFQTIRYWEDADSGHWEETRKVQASSIGVVVAALIEMRKLMIKAERLSFFTARKPVTVTLLDELIEHGQSVLNLILPWESVQPGHERRYDAALLFLIYPLEIVNGSQADAILRDVETHLKGDYGIRRYIGDSFWCANYDELVIPERRTMGSGDDLSERNALLREGEEAQWCIFDPIVSVIYGRLYEHRKQKHYLSKQIEYLNRSLGQLTAPDSGFQECLCPELYYLKGDCYIPNDVTPLLWTQANLMLAIRQMEISTIF